MEESRDFNGYKFCQKKYFIMIIFLGLFINPKIMVIFFSFKIYLKKMVIIC